MKSLIGKAVIGYVIPLQELQWDEKSWALVEEVQEWQNWLVDDCQEVETRLQEWQAQLGEPHLPVGVELLDCDGELVIGERFEQKSFTYDAAAFQELRILVMRLLGEDPGQPQLWLLK